MPARVRIGVVGCGLIAQVMHLPYLAELSDRYDISSLCDLSPGLAALCGERYGVARIHTRWQDLLDDELDAVMVLTSGDHAPPAIAAAERGLHVFVEKPMSLSSRGGARMVEAARDTGVRLMVGTMKRYDPAYERLVELVHDLNDLRLVRVTTLESPLAPYVAHYPLIEADPLGADVRAGLEQADADAIEDALGDADERTRWCYRWILLDNLVHELNALRGALGEPSEIRSADLSERCVNINLRFGSADCHLSWVDLPGIARYRQEFAFYGPDQRMTLKLPSPFLRNMPSRLLVEGGESGTSHSWEREELVSFEEAFKCELIAFHASIASGIDPPTSGIDGLNDIRLCELIAQTHMRADAHRAGRAAVGGLVGGEA